MVPKDVRETQSLNEVWLNVQRKFIQDHQDIDNATGRSFKLVWIEKLQVSIWRNSRKGWSKTYVLALLDLDESFISTMMHLVQMWNVSLYERKRSGLLIKSTKEAWVEIPNMHLELSILKHGSNIFLEVKVTYRRDTRIYRTSSLSWSWACIILVGIRLIMTWKSAITLRSKDMADALSNEELC